MDNLHGAFYDWLRERGGYVHPDISLFHDAGNGDRGVSALRDVARGDVLLRVPTTATIHMPQQEAAPRAAPGTRCKPDPESSPAPALEGSVGDLRSGGGDGQLMWGGERMAISVDAGTSGLMSGAVPGVDPPLCRADVLSFLGVAGREMSPFAVALLVLLGEMAAGEGSQYKPYLDSLPLDSNCVWNWNEREAVELEGTFIRSSVGSFALLFDGALKPAFETRPDLWPCPWNSMEKALHAACMLQSRAFHMQADNWVTGVVSKGSQLFMLPGIDMVNHSCNPKDLNTTLRYIRVDSSSEEANCLEGISKLNQEKCSTASSHSYFVMKAEQDIKAGEPILHSYGDLSDGQLLQVYGFIGSTDVHQNPHNWVAVPWKIVKESCCDIAKRKDWPLGDICKREDFLCNQKLLYCPVDEVQFAVAAHQELPKELVTVVQILLMAAEDFADVVKEYVGDCSLEPGNRPLVMGERYMDSSDWSEVVCLALLKTLDMCLCMYPTTIEEDSALLASDKMLPNSPRRLAAVLLRMEEKQILKAARKQVLTLLVRCCNEEDEEESGDGSRDFDSDGDDEGDCEDGDSLEDEDDVEKGTKTGRNKRQRTNC